MKNTPNQIDRKILKTLEPLNRLNPILLDELAAKSIIDEVPADRIICRHGENDSRQIYLLSGQIEVVKAGETKTTIIKSKTALKTPVAEGSPRIATLKAKTASTLLYIDADLLELLMSDEPELNATYQVSEIGAKNDDDWMLAFLQSPAFLQLPTENIQKLLTHMDEIPVKKDQVVITQGGTDDNYYIIKSGSCNVHRKPYKDAANVLLAVLPAGSGFGEEALISNGSRNATITMRENGSLMRLKKKDFLSLLIKPIISYYENSETQEKLDNGSVIIDVRTELQSKEKPLKGAVNIPLSMLRVKFDSLKSDREYLLVCNDGSQSAAAAFLMIQTGFKSSVLKGGLKNLASKPAVAAKAVSNTTNKMKEQAEKIARQQQQIKAAREKAEQDMIRHKKELAESRARIAQKKQKISSVSSETSQLKEKAAQELAKAKAESKAIELRQKETNDAMKRAEEMMKQSAAQAEQARKQAEQEATLIKQRAIEEAEHLRAEVEAARIKMEQEAVRIKEEEQLIKKSALKIKNEADEIRREAVNEAQKARSEIEATRASLEQKLQQTQNEEKRKHDAILAKAKKEADALSATKTQQAVAEAESIRQKAKEDAARLHSELETTRKQIETEAAQVISELKEQQSRTRIISEEDVHVIEEEVVVELVAESVDYKAVSIPGMSAIEPIDDDEAKRKAEAIKAKLTQTADNIKVQKNNNKTILEGDDDLFIFKEPATSAETSSIKAEQPAVSQRTQAETILTQIDIKPKKSVAIYPKQEQKTANRNNPFLNQEESQISAGNYASSSVSNINRNPQQFDKQAYMRKHQSSKSNTLAIAASFLLILAGAVFTLHATNTLKVQSIAALFNSGNDTVQPAITSIAKSKTIRKKVLRANTKVNVKKKVSNKMDDIMSGWKNVLSEAENPKKLKDNQ